jgi:transposase
MKGIGLIVIGVDAHKQTHTAAAVDGLSARALGEKTVVARSSGHEELLRWGLSHGDERLWAIEDCRHVSGALERLLLRRGEAVVRVPPRLMADARRAGREPGKSDSIDALAIARAAIREDDLPRAQMAGPEREIALLVDLRDDLVREAGRHASRLRWLLHDLDPRLEPPARGFRDGRTLERLARRLRTLEQTTQVRVCRELVRRIAELHRSAKGIEAELRPLVRARAKALLALPGCGVLTAAKLIAEVGDVERFSHDAQLARYGGVAPLDASSGKQQRHRLNRTGNRQLNFALHIIAITQARIHEPARRYLARRVADGKTTKEALRALKRHLVRRVFRLLKAAQAHDLAPLPGAAPSKCLT